MDGGLDAQQEDALFAHIDNCPQCARYYDDMLLMLDLLPERDVEPPYGYSAEWQECVEIASTKKSGSGAKALVPVLAVGLCCVVAVSAVFAANNGLLNVVSLPGDQKQTVQSRDPQEEEQQEGDMFLQPAPAVTSPSDSEETQADQTAGGLLEESKDQPDGGMTADGIINENQMQSAATGEEKPYTEEAPADADATPAPETVDPAAGLAVLAEAPHPIFDVKEKKLKQALFTYLQEKSLENTPESTILFLDQPEKHSVLVEAPADKILALMTQFELVLPEGQVMPEPSPEVGAQLIEIIYEQVQVP